MHRCVKGRYRSWIQPWTLNPMRDEPYRLPHNSASRGQKFRCKKRAEFSGWRSPSWGEQQDASLSCRPQLPPDVARCSRWELAWWWGFKAARYSPGQPRYGITDKYCANTVRSDERVNNNSEWCGGSTNSDERKGNQQHRPMAIQDIGRGARGKEEPRRRLGRMPVISTRAASFRRGPAEAHSTM